MLEIQPWPGNVRELRLVVERAAVLANGAAIDSSVLADALAHGGEFQGAPIGQPSPPSLNAGEELLRVCDENGWRSVRIAAALGVSRATLFRRLHDMGMTLRSLKVSRRSHQTHLTVRRT